MDLPPGTHSQRHDFTDLDGDGADEMMIQWGHNCTFFDTPSYNAVLALSDPAIEDIELVRIGNSTSMDILVTYQSDSHFNVSVISGKDFKEAWRSPDISGVRWMGVVNYTVRDLDADGRPELVFSVLESDTTCFQVFDAVTFELEWSCPGTGGEQPYLPFCMQDLDGDPALELLTSRPAPNHTYDNPISAYDGATHERQWTVSLPPDFNFVPSWERFSDIDNDSEKELVLPYNSTGEPGRTTCGLNVYSARNGTFERGFGPWPGRLAVRAMDDLNGDGWKEFLMQCSTLTPQGGRKDTYSIFSPKENLSLWTAGPFVMNDYESYFARIEDIDRQGTPEVMFTKRIEHGDDNLTAIFQVISGKDLSVKWTSRELATYELFPETYRPSDGSAPRLILVEQTGVNSGFPNSTLDIVSTTDFVPLFNGRYEGQLQVIVDDWNGDSVADLLLEYNGLELLDGNKLSRIWKAVWHGTGWSGIGAADICGGPGYEIMRSSVSGGYRIINGTSREWYTSVISVHDPQTLEQIWSSQSLDGTFLIDDIEDIDNDSNMEALFVVHRYDEPYSASVSYVIVEFPKEAPTAENPWPPGLNLRAPTIGIDRPQNRQRVQTRVQIAGTAEDDNRILQVAVRIDDGEWANATLALAPGNLTCSWNQSWDCSQALKGNHTIHAKAFDGMSWSSEAEVTVRISGTGTPAPEWPAPTINSFPNLACIALMVAALVAAVAAFLVHRRGK